MSQARGIFSTQWVSPGAPPITMDFLQPLGLPRCSTGTYTVSIISSGIQLRHVFVHRDPFMTLYCKMSLLIRLGEHKGQPQYQNDPCAPRSMGVTYIFKHGWPLCSVEHAAHCFFKAGEPYAPRSMGLTGIFFRWMNDKKWAFWSAIHNNVRPTISILFSWFLGIRIWSRSLLEYNFTIFLYHFNLCEHSY